MLVITRRIGESILIGTDLAVKVIDADAYRKKVRLGVQAPPETEIRRAEQQQQPSDQTTVRLETKRDG
jgi:carbon storage regulator CsrA